MSWNERSNLVTSFARADCHKGRATPLKLKVFALTFTLTLMRWRATALKMKDFVMNFTLSHEGRKGFFRRLPVRRTSLISEFRRDLQVWFA